MKKIYRLLLYFALLLVPVSVVSTQSSEKFEGEHTVIASGGASSSRNFSAAIVIGQSSTGVVKSENYQVSSGFLHSTTENLAWTYSLWLPVINNGEVP